ncbi:hypothetical protein JTB14_021680 [Gonioctena quinquepunctata]|nr:hypothetical protein JTB14_021680 [Gonioctena quinquepunctata]
MMRSVICLKKNVDIQKYSNLLAFLKQNAVGYQSTKPKLLTKQELDTFLKEADDNTYLLMKVALIIGISGSCSRDELSYLLINDVKDEGYYFRITITSNQTRCHRDFIILDETTNEVNSVEIIRKYIRLRPLHADQPRFLLTYRNGKCTSQPVGVNKIGVFPKKAASFLGLSDPEGYTGYRSGRSARQGGTVGRKTIAVRNEYDEYI